MEFFSFAFCFLFSHFKKKKKKMVNKQLFYPVSSVYTRDVTRTSRSPRYCKTAVFCFCFFWFFHSKRDSNASQKVTRGCQGHHRSTVVRDTVTFSPRHPRVGASRVETRQEAHTSSGGRGAGQKSRHTLHGQRPLSSHNVSVHLQRVDATHHPPSSSKGGIGRLQEGLFL